MNIPNAAERHQAPPADHVPFDWHALHAMAVEACNEGADRYEALVNEAQAAAGDPAAAEVAWRAAVQAGRALLGAQAWVDVTRERASAW